MANVSTKKFIKMTLEQAFEYMSGGPIITRFKGINVNSSSQSQTEREFRKELEAEVGQAMERVFKKYQVTKVEMW